MADQRSAKQSGYALLIVAATMVAAGGTALLGRIPEQFREAERVQQTTVTAQLKSLQSAILRYARLHRRLPCPAHGSATDAEAGVEQRADGRCAVSESLAAPVETIDGVVPWRTLGLSRQSALDPWGHLFAYAVFQGDDAGNGDLAAPSGLDPLRCAEGPCPFWDLDMVPNPIGELARLTALTGDTPPGNARNAKRAICSTMAAAVLTRQTSAATGQPRPIGVNMASVCNRDTVDCSRLGFVTAGEGDLENQAAFYVLSYGPEGQGGWSGYGARVTAADGGRHDSVTDNVIDSISVSTLFDSVGIPPDSITERFCAFETVDLSSQVAEVLAEAATSAGLIPNAAAFPSVFATNMAVDHDDGRSDGADSDADPDENGGGDAREDDESEDANDADDQGEDEAGSPEDLFFAEGLGDEDEDEDDADDSDDDDCYVKFGCADD